MQMDFERGLDHVWVVDVGQAGHGGPQETSPAGQWQKAPLLSRERLKWEPSPATRHWRTSQGGLLCERSPAAPLILLLPDELGANSPKPQSPSPSWWAMCGH